MKNKGIEKNQHVEIYISSSQVQNIVIDHLIENGFLSQYERDRLLILGGNPEEGWTDVKDIMIRYQV